MATGNQGQGQGRRNSNEGKGPDRNSGSGAVGGLREQAQNVGQNLQQGAEAVAGRLREGYGSAQEEVSRRYRSAEGMFARNPSSSVMIGFGIGVGLGLALTALLVPHEETLSERYLPDSWQDHLPDSLRRVRPSDVREHADSLQDSFSQLAEQVRDLSAQVAKYRPGR